MFIDSIYSVFMRKLSQDEFLQKAFDVHGDRYDYINAVYQSARQRVEIICREHGPFFQLARSHIHQRQGCPQCAPTLPLSEAQFDQRVTEQHGAQFKRIGTFRGLKHPIEMECRTHGLFTSKMAETHLRGDGGCPTCTKLTRIENLKTGNISSSEREWLDQLGIGIRQHRLTINGQDFIVDGYDDQSKTVYEYYGSFWHGNPDVYDSTAFNAVLGVTFGELLKKTLIRESIIREHYNLVVMWGR